MPKESAGLLVYRIRNGMLEVFLAHPGGPYWAKKDDGAWTIPKGEFDPDEEPLAAAKREFQEETGFELNGELIPLEPIRQPSGKIVYAWVVQGDFDPAALKSNTCAIEWPPKSGKQMEIPEVDRGEWFGIEAANTKIMKGQIGLIKQLCGLLGNS